MRYPAALALACLLGSPALRAQVALPCHDSFTYTAGAALAGQGAWAAASGAGTVLTASGTLDRSPLSAGTGGKVTLLPSGSAARTALAFVSRSSGTVYVSFLLKVTSVPSATRLIAFASGSTSSTSTPALGFFVTAGGALAVGVKTGAPGFTSAPLASGEAHLVVVGYTFAAGGDSAEIWLDPASLGAPPSASVGTTGGSHTTSLGYFLWNTPSASSGGGAYEVDELRIADTFAEAAPGLATGGGGDTGGGDTGGGGGSGGGGTGTVDFRVTHLAREAGGLRLRGAGGTPGGRFQVIAANDLTLPPQNWELVASGDFGADGAFDRVAPLPEGTPARFYRIDPALPPGFATPPQGRTVGAGQEVTIPAGATGSTQLAYQWYRDGQALAGQTGAALHLASITPAEAGDYTVVVSNAAGSATSGVARVVVGDAPDAAALYVSPTGLDTHPGTLDQPIRSLQLALTRAKPGETIYLRGGTYAYGTTIRFETSGQPGKTIKVWAYPGEKPVLDFSSQPYGAANRALLVTSTASYWHLKGLEIAHAGDNAIKIEGSHLVIEQCVFHHNGDSGLQIGFGHTDPNPGGLLAAFIEVINCDSYLNFDSDSNGGDADGFAAKLHCGQGIVFRGCRAWENSDDGWDLFETDYGIVIEDCWTWKSGVAQGNGNGFKLGGNGTGGNSYGTHVARRCVAFGHKVNGFTQNSHRDGEIVEHCLSFGNGTSGYNYFMEGTLNAGKQNVFRNNVSIPRSGTNGGGFIGDNAPVEQNNTWNLAVSASTADFVDLSAAAAGAPRGADGSLPTGFARLLAGSDLIDAGANIGLPFFGAAPDLGAFETAP